VRVLALGVFFLGFCANVCMFVLVVLEGFCIISNSVLILDMCVLCLLDN
jgi:hypothetical protein